MKKGAKLLGVFIAIATIVIGCESVTQSDVTSSDPNLKVEDPGISANSHYVFPSTNDANRDNGDPHVNQLSADVGETILEFVNPKTYIVCFEYRTDGDTSQATGDPNFNSDIHDLYPFTCLTNETEELTLEANEYVEVRSVFGAERDHDFDWTRFDVLQDAQTKNDCKNGGWQDYGFKNQGQCIRYVNTGKDSR